MFTISILYFITVKRLMLPDCSLQPSTLEQPTLGMHILQRVIHLPLKHANGSTACLNQAKL